MNTERMYMNLHTGSVDTYQGWWYESATGNLVNAVDLGEVVEVIRTGDDEWEAVE